jgi:hypothetical protein
LVALKPRSFLLFLALVSCLSLSAQAAEKTSDSGPDKVADEPSDKSKEKTTDDAKKKDESAPAEDKAFGHRSQLGLRVGLVGGYNMIFRYDQSPLCSPYDVTKSLQDQQKFCGHAAPLALDIAASYAILDFLEPYVFMRLGLTGESQTDTAPVKILGAGARLYTMSDSAFKIFIEPGVAYEFEGSAGTVSHPGYAPQYKDDFLFHLAAGPQFDVARYVGFYLDAGLTVGILRALRTQLELQGGVQARFP